MRILFTLTVLASLISIYSTAQTLSINTNFDNSNYNDDKGFDLTKTISPDLYAAPRYNDYAEFFTVRPGDNNSLIILFDFVAEQNSGGNNLLQWQGSSSETVSAYIVERSPDGNLFSEIDSISTSDYSEQTTGYDYIDEQPLEESNYYRLKMIKRNGEYYYSPIIVVHEEENDKPLMLYSNPVLDHLSLRLTGNRKATVRIRNAAGITIRQFVFNLNGSMYSTLDIRKLPPGNYFLQLNSNSKNYIHPFIKM